MTRDPNQDKTTKLLLECTIIRISSCVVVNIDVLSSEQESIFPG